MINNLHSPAGNVGFKGLIEVKTNNGKTLISNYTIPEQDKEKLDIFESCINKENGEIRKSKDRIQMFPGRGSIKYETIRPIHNNKDERIGVSFMYNAAPKMIFEYTISTRDSKPEIANRALFLLDQIEPEE